MSKLAEIKGQRFGRLQVLERAPAKKGQTYARWRCRCDCGGEAIASGSSLRRGETQSCGCYHLEVIRRKGPEHKNWRGGRWKTKYGYVLVYAPEHPRVASRSVNSSNQRFFVFEHILVMEKMISRTLLPQENVHHKNGVRDDNRPENLELWLSSQPKGQRIDDLVTWAKEILMQYEPTALRPIRAKLF